MLKEICLLRAGFIKWALSVFILSFLLFMTLPAISSSLEDEKKEKFEVVKLRALSGHAEDQLNLGVLYAEGFGVNRDDKEAIKWFTLSADQGNAEAQTHLGYMYKMGDGVVKDYAEAVRYYKLAAYQNYSYAQIDLATMYHAGKGVTRDLVTAYAWLSISSFYNDESLLKDAAKDNMTQEQIVKGQALAKVISIEINRGAIPE